MWTTRGGFTAQPDELLAQVIAAGTEGLTLLGGEPFDQASPLALLASGVRDAGLSVMTFTGFTWQQLQQAVAVGRSDVAALLRATDLLVDGPYLADRPDRHRPWVGSTNQRFRFLTERYAHLRDQLRALPDRVEVNVGPDGQVAVNGWASVDALEELLEGLGTRIDPGSRAG
jgi:anaerobic ribonucleoside-triphosphate reductase activating protein